MKIEDYEEAMKTHFWAPLYATLAVLPTMRQRHEGRIVATLSPSWVTTLSDQAAQRNNEML